jgi:hypothetical protein
MAKQKDTPARPGLRLAEAAPPAGDPPREPVLPFRAKGAWQYLVEFMHGDYRGRLNELGREGWELVFLEAARQHVSKGAEKFWTDGVRGTFKRPWPDE